MKRWIPVGILFALAIICSIATMIYGLGAYLAVTGLDLLVTAKKSLSLWTLILSAVSNLLWLVSFDILMMQKPWKTDK